jgi:hypothetical protein
MREMIEITKAFWPYYIPAWSFFPVLVLLFRGFNASATNWAVPLMIFALVAGISPWVPWVRRQVSYWSNAVPAILVPLVSWPLAIALVPPGFAA